jgi:hypothetical protein
LTEALLLSVSKEDEDEDEAVSSGVTALALQATALTLLFVVCSGVNILVTIVFYRRPALRSPSNRSEIILKNYIKNPLTLSCLMIKEIGV